ncbi:flavoprotein [Streptomyces sp. JHA19]|uniref:flavoprotein n=1 Tax=Streptomyces sp. JHA19 TaxID=1577588 RepID=UPI0006E3D42B|nr:flavoprotein [Streptomyces sp. JHA19]
MTERTQAGGTPTERTPAGEAGKPGKPFLYVVVCAAGIAAEVDKLVGAALERDWEVGVIATPAALNGFFDTTAVETLTGRPIRSAWRTPADPRPFPPPDAVAVAPATFNTINKWAAGIADTLALGTLCEASGLGVPVAVLPCVADALAVHPAYRDSLERLRGMGARIGEPYTGEPGPDGVRAEFGWERALDLLTGPGAP